MPIKNIVKSILAQKDMTMTQLVMLLNERYDRTDSLANISKKLNNNTLKFREAEEIAEVLNCDLKFIARNTKKTDD